MLTLEKFLNYTCKPRYYGKKRTVLLKDLIQKDLDVIRSYDPHALILCMHTCTGEINGTTKNYCNNTEVTPQAVYEALQDMLNQDDIYNLSIGIVIGKKSNYKTLVDSYFLCSKTYPTGWVFHTASNKWYDVAVDEKALASSER